MSGRMAGKMALISGASNGLSAAQAKLFARKGAWVGRSAVLGADPYTSSGGYPVRSGRRYSIIHGHGL